MFKLNLTGEVQEVEPGLQLLLSESFFSELTGKYHLAVKKETEPGFSVKIKPDGAEIGYGEKADFFRSLSFFIQHRQEPGYEIKEKPCFDKTGVMFDCSRNAVLTVATLKGLLRKMALMGLNLGMLYTEDTYEVKTRPYFGYMRGRYTEDELRELDDFADALGIGLVPCIQTLAHLERALQWPAMEPLRDSERSLMVGEDATYKFIEEMIVAATASYRSNRIHIGMDEAWELGLGRYLKKYGYHTCAELMAEHLKRVKEILNKHNLHAMMWSDMHFTAASPTRDLYDENCSLTPEILAGAPENIDLVYWDYYNETEAHYDKLLKLHGKFSAKTVFAGGIWTWIGPETDYRKTIAASIPGLNQCVKNHVQEVLATCWGDDGAEANLQTVLYGLQLFAEFRYTGTYCEDSVRERFSACCGADAQSFLDISLFHEIPGVKWMEHSTVTPAKTLLYEDPLMPLFEEDFRGTPCAEHFSMLAGRFADYAAAQPQFHLLFEFYAKYANAVYQKCIWREQASACVRACDRDAAAKLPALADSCMDAVRDLKTVWAKLWYSTNKPFGFEVIDLRLGGLIGRFETAKIRLEQFARGELDTIPELSEAKLPYLREADGTFRCMNSWGSIATVCRIVG